MRSRAADAREARIGRCVSLRAAADVWILSNFGYPNEGDNEMRKSSSSQLLQEESGVSPPKFRARSRTPRC